MYTDPGVFQAKLIKEVKPMKHASEWLPPCTSTQTTLQLKGVNTISPQRLQCVCVWGGGSLGFQENKDTHPHNRLHCSFTIFAPFDIQLVLLSTHNTILILPHTAALTVVLKDWRLEHGEKSSSASLSARAKFN